MNSNCFKILWITLNSYLLLNASCAMRLNKDSTNRLSASETKYDERPRYQSRECNPPSNCPYFSNNQRNHAPDAAYHSQEEAYSVMAALEKNYPDLVSVLPIKSTAKSNPNASPEHDLTPGKLPYYAVLVTKNARTIENGRPNVMFFATTHAREIMSTEVGLDIIEYLATSYDENPQVKRWLDRTNVWVLPVINPDGLKMIWNGYPYTRKNLRQVDLARNFPFEFGACKGGSSGDLKSDTYRGPKAASEIETRHQMYMIEKYRPVILISYHSTGELVMMPGTCEGSYVNNRQLYVNLAKEFADLIPNDCRDGFYRYGETFNELYNTDGDLISWAHFNFGTLAFLIESNDVMLGFQPEYKTWRNTTVGKLRATWKYALERLWHSAVFGQVTDSQGRALDHAEIFIGPLNNSREAAHKETYKVRNDGRFHIILEPGEYRIRIQADGYRVQEFSNFKIYDSAKEINVALDP